MAMTDVMTEVDYVTADFRQLEDSNHDYNNYDTSLQRHPLWMSEGHFLYHLYRDPQGNLAFKKDLTGEPICSPRKLRDLCVYQTVLDPKRLEVMKLNALPSDLYPCLMTEAMLQRQLKSIAYLVSTWPLPILHVQSLIPGEELVGSDYLTAPTDTGECMSLMDGFSLGLLNLKSHSRLRYANFTGFRHDRRLCKELLRLPIIWMKPGDRQSGYLHSILRKTLEISKDKVEKYVNRISCIYSNIDLLVRHGHLFGPVTVVLDCKLTIDDVLIGLALQAQSPFRFVCQRAWLEVLPDVCMPFSELTKVLESRYLTHIEIEDSEVCSDISRWDNLLEGLALLTELQSLSLPNTIHVTLLPTATVQFGQVLASLEKLKKLSLASCTLRDSLGGLLSRLHQGLTYLNLRDCRLVPSDVTALLLWSGVSSLRELNMSRNNLGAVASVVANLLTRMDFITCFSVSYCSLSLEDIRLIVRHCLDCSSLKVLCVQSFIPPPVHEIRCLLEDCVNIPTLQKCILLPEAYAFPGTHISQRSDNHSHMVVLCSQNLDQLGRPDIQVE